MPVDTKPRVFIGSSASANALTVAYAIQNSLQYDANCSVWTQGIFESGKTPIEALMKALAEHDFAVFVFLPEDI
jgi:predicted nucleotide-binding protein